MANRRRWPSLKVVYFLKWHIRVCTPGKLEESVRSKLPAERSKILTLRANEQLTSQQWVPFVLFIEGTVCALAWFRIRSGSFIIYSPISWSQFNNII